MKEGRWADEQVGVKAPGMATMMTFLLANSVVGLVHLLWMLLGGGEGRRTSRGLVVLGDAAGLDALDLGSVGDVREGDVLGERGSGLELSHFGGVVGWVCRRSCWNYSVWKKVSE